MKIVITTIIAGVVGAFIVLGYQHFIAPKPFNDDQAIQAAEQAVANENSVSNSEDKFNDEGKVTLMANGNHRVIGSYVNDDGAYQGVGSYEAIVDNNYKVIHLNIGGNDEY